MWLFVVLAVHLVAASDGGDADAVVISLSPSRWADNLYPLSEELAVVRRAFPQDEF